MIAWLNPAALALLALGAVPLIIHLLLRRRAARVPFPTIRFLTPSEQSAVRLRRPSDLLLLVVRIGIVGAAALAMVRPLLVTDARMRALGQRPIRAVVVDTSASVHDVRASEAAAAEAAGAFSSRRFDGTDLPDALARASHWLSTAEPGRHEIVVISDFQGGALATDDLARVAAEIGIRGVRVERAAPARTTLEAPAVFHEGMVLGRSVTVDERSTRVTLAPSSGADGLVIGADPRAAARITSAIASAGAVAPAVNQPIEMRFGASAENVASVPWERDWRFDAARSLLVSPDAGPVLPVAARDGALVVHVTGTADSLAAAQATQAALDARFGLRGFAEGEPGSIPPQVVNSWSRTPSLPDVSAWRRSRESDGRWFWVLAVGLMGLETYLRRARATREAVLDAHAA